MGRERWCPSSSSDIVDVLVCVQTFAAMVGVLSTKYPSEFMAYQSLIVKCSRDYDCGRQVAVTKYVRHMT